MLKMAECICLTLNNDEYENSNAASPRRRISVSDNTNQSTSIYQLSYELWTSLSLTQIKT